MPADMCDFAHDRSHCEGVSDVLQAIAVLWVAGVFEGFAVCEFVLHRNVVVSWLLEDAVQYGGPTEMLDTHHLDMVPKHHHKLILGISSDLMGSKHQLLVEYFLVILL